MNKKHFEKLHIDAVGLGNQAEAINKTIGTMFRNKTDRANYLYWVTETAKDDRQGSEVQKLFAKQIKAVQKNINLTNTQKLMLNGKVSTEALTEKVRLIRANRPMLANGECTQMDIDNKQYFFITKAIPKTTHTLITDLESLMKKWGAEPKTIIKALS